MEVRKWITYYACFFVAAFSAGLIIGYKQQQSGGPVAMAVEYSRVKSEADTAIISIICPGNELLYTYVVGEPKATPNLLTEVAGYKNVMDLSNMPIPEAGGFFGGVVAFLGVGGTWEEVKTGKAKFSRLTAVAAGILTGYPFGWYVGAILLPRPCSTAPEVFRKLGQEDWQGIADKILFRDFFDLFSARCKDPEKFGNELLGGMHGHATAKDFSLLKQAESDCVNKGKN